MGDLFNLDRALTPSERRRLRGGTQAKGYAAPPGTGPAGETCGTCDHLVRKQLAKVYRKCGLMERHWTGGKGTDVLATAPACRNWTAIESRKDLSGQNVSLSTSDRRSGNATATKGELLSSEGDSIPSLSEPVERSQLRIEPKPEDDQ